jgi:hypothetical protein
VNGKHRVGGGRVRVARLADHDLVERDTSGRELEDGCVRPLARRRSEQAGAGRVLGRALVVELHVILDDGVSADDRDRYAQGTHPIDEASDGGVDGRVRARLVQSGGEPRRDSYRVVRRASPFGRRNSRA